MKATLSAYFWHSLYGQLSVTQDFIFCSKIFKVISFLNGPGESSHILDAKDEIRSVLK